MAEAVLRIKPEGGAEVARLLADVERLVEATQQRRERSGRASRQRQQRDQQQATATELAGYRTSAKAADDSFTHITRSRLRALALQGAAERKFTADFTRAYQDATRAIEAETGKRIGLSDKEQRRVENLALALVHSRERAEQRITRSIEEEHRKRTRLTAERVGAVGRVAGQVGSTGLSVAQQLHAELQDARTRRAAIQSSVIGAVSQVGVTDLGEVNAITDRVVNAAVQHGLAPEVIANAIGAAQTQFSTLGAMDTLGGAANQGRRADVYQEAINTAVQGRNLGVDPGEFSRLMGMLGQAGMGANDRQFLAAWTVAAQDRGAVETGSVTREGLASIMARMNAAGSALGPNATPEQRSAAMRAGYQQAFAELEVFKSLGESVRRAGGAMVGFERALTNQGVLRRMQGNIATLQDPAQRARVQQALFTRDGQLRQGLDNPLRFASALMGAGMNDPRAIANLFAGTGAGNPMSLTSNFRAMLLGLASRDANGRTAADRINALTDAGIAMSPQAMAARAALYEQSDAAKLASEEAERLKALTENTAGIRDLSNTIARMQAQNPLAGKVVPAAAGLLTAAIGGTKTAAGLVGASILNSAGSGLTGENLAGRKLSLGERATRLMNAVNGAPGAVASIGTAAQDVYAAAQNGQLERLFDRFANRVAQAVTQNPPQVSSHDVAHVVATQNTRPRTIP